MSITWIGYDAFFLAVVVFIAEYLSTLDKCRFKITLWIYQHCLLNDRGINNWGLPSSLFKRWRFWSAETEHVPFLSICSDICGEWKKKWTSTVWRSQREDGRHTLKNKQCKTWRFGFCEFQSPKQVYALSFSMQILTAWSWQVAEIFRRKQTLWNKHFRCSLTCISFFIWILQHFSLLSVGCVSRCTYALLIGTEAINFL